MGYFNSLRPACRTRRKDDITQIFRMVPIINIPIIISIVEITQIHLLLRQDLFTSISQNQLCIGNLQHILYPVFRIVRSDRHIRPSRFQHSQHRHDHMPAPLRYDRNHIIPLYAFFPQIMRKSVRHLVKLSVSKTLIFKNQCCLIRCLLCLLHKEFVDALIPWIVYCRIIEIIKQPMFFFIRKNRNIFDIFHI